MFSVWHRFIRIGLVRMHPPWVMVRYGYMVGSLGYLRWGTLSAVWDVGGREVAYRPQWLGCGRCYKGRTKNGIVSGLIYWIISIGRA